MKVRFAHRAEYAALRAAVAVVSLLPWRAASAFGAAIGRLGYWPLRIRRRVVDRQLAAALPELDDAARRRTARDSYASIGMVAIQTAVASRMTPAAILDLFHPPAGWEHVEGPVREGRGVLLVSGHVGNWELGGAYVAARGIPIDGVVRKMSNPLVDGYLTRSRRRLGWEAVYDGDAVRRVPRSIASGRVVALLADQGVQGLSAIFVPFFGRLARTPRGPALLALRLKAPCVFAAVLREPDGKYRIYFDPVPVVDTGDREKDIDAIVAAYTRQLEMHVRRVPGQYFWQHRRWRRRPDGTMED